MSTIPRLFLFDVDNTLLDNDRVIADLMRHLEGEVGPRAQARYWAIFEEIRKELGYADYLGALQRYRIEHPRDPHLLAVSSFLVNYPFANRLFPDSLDVVEHVRQWGPAVILSDGDVVFQPRKVERSGLFEAVDGNMLIYIHKELELEDVETALSGRPLRPGRRQAAHLGRGQTSLGRSRDHGIPAARALRQGSDVASRSSGSRPDHRPNRRIARLRPRSSVHKIQHLSLSSLPPPVGAAIGALFSHLAMTNRYTVVRSTTEDRVQRSDLRRCSIS